MIIRPAKDGDAEYILSLIRCKAEFDGCLSSLNSQLSDIQNAFFSEAPKAQALLAFKDHRAVGLATYYDIYSTFLAKPGLWLDDLYVLDDYRKRGVGLKLMTELASIAVQKGCGRIDWIVATENDHAQGFYKSLGAKIFEQVRHARLDETKIQQLVAAHAAPAL